MSDLIDRQAAIDVLWEIRQEEISDGRRFHDYCSLSTAVDVIKDLPSVQPQRQTGKWIGYNADKEDWKRTDGSPVFMSCSECYGMVLNNGSAHWNYCPSCGAKMEVEA